MQSLHTACLVELIEIAEVSPGALWSHGLCGAMAYAEAEAEIEAQDWTKPS